MDKFYEAALETLPDELLFDIAIKMDPRSIQRLCRTSTRFSGICDDKYFWTQKLTRDFPDYPIVGDPKEHYRKISQDEGEEYHQGNVFIPGNRYPAGTEVFYVIYQVFPETDSEPIYGNRVFAFNFAQVKKLLANDIKDEILDSLYSLNENGMAGIDGDSIYGTILLTQIDSYRNVGKFNDPDFTEIATEAEFVQKYTRDIERLDVGKSLSYRFDDHDVEVLILVAILRLD